MTRLRKSRVYCSAVDRMVPALVKGGRRRWSRASSEQAEAVTCLDYGVRCTGAMCPLFSLTTLEEHALPETPHPRSGGS